MLYQLKVDALIVVSIFGAVGLVIAALFVFEQVKGLLEAHRFFANPVTISRMLSRNPERGND